MIRIAMLSRWHVHAKDYIQEIGKYPNVEISAVWDESEDRGRTWAEELGVPFVENLYDLLSNPDIDGVIVNAPTTQHYEIISAALQRRKHVFTEKVLATDYHQCKQLLALAEEQEVKLVVSMPRLTQAPYVVAQRVVMDGLLGEVTQVRCRLAHDGTVARGGKKEGWLPPSFLDKQYSAGGALMDLGAHPIYVVNRLGGTVASVSARLPGIDSPRGESMAVVVVEYQSGVLGVIETSFRVAGNPFELQVYGTNGSLFASDQKVVIHHRRESDGHIETLHPTALEISLPSPLQQWIESIELGYPPFITKEDVLNLTLVNALAIQSERTGRRIVVEES
jgi:predicted dehydrogenase